VTVSGVEPGLPHLQHIHGFAGTTESQCPPQSADTSEDGLVSVGEGAVFYGPIFVKTLSTTGAQEPLDLGIAPVANRGGNYTYSYTFEVEGDALDVADESIVVHGLDLDGDGSYSNLTEASLPVLCGEITRRRWSHLATRGLSVPRCTGTRPTSVASATSRKRRAGSGRSPWSCSANSSSSRRSG